MAVAAAARSAGCPLEAERRQGRESSDLEKLGFLFLEGIVDGVDVGLRHRFEFLLAASDLVFADLFLEAVEVVLRAATDVADRHLRVFALATHDLDELATTLLGE